MTRRQWLPRRIVRSALPAAGTAAAAVLAGCMNQQGAPGSREPIARSTPVSASPPATSPTPADARSAGIDSSSPLVEPTPQVRPVATPPPPWAPDWFRPGATRHNGSPAAGAVATAADLLEARRTAISEAVAALGVPPSGGVATVERTVTHRLDDGSFRVWVRVVVEQG